MKRNYAKRHATQIKKRKLITAILFLIFYSAGYAQQTYTFTNCGATGSVGPTQTQITFAYTATNLSLTTSTGPNSGIQTFTVVQSGLHLIDVYGASGGTTTLPNANPGGLGSRMQGEFFLTAGSVLRILVGQKGENRGAGTGGGGSYVTVNNLPIIIAGGGGGSTNDQAGAHSVTVTSGTNDNPGGTTPGGTGGNGGAACNTGVNNAGGGGGYLTDGGTGTGVLGGFGNGGGGSSFLNGGIGGMNYIVAGYGQGGFGGGGGSTSNNYVGGGGGGGYSGGAGGQQTGNCNGLINRSGGGGGGSYNTGTNQLNIGGSNYGDGKVIIKELCSITLSVTGLNSSGAICAGNSVTLTTNAVSNYSWSTGATSSSIVVSPVSNAVYSLTGTSSASCNASSFITITVNTVVPTLTITNTASAGGICPTKSVNLLATGAITYTWTGGSPTVTNGVSFNPTATYTYVVAGTNGCGTSTAVTSVSIHPFPTVFPVASSSTLCSGSTLTLTAAGNATNYAWSGGNAPAGNGVGFVPPASIITYSVIGTSALSCTALATIPVTVYATPVIAPAATPALICIGGSSTLSAQGAISYTWASATQTVFTPNMVVTPTGTGVTTYTITKSNSSCSDTKTINVTTNSLPTIFALASPPIVCALQPATISIAGGQSYTWTAPGTPTYNFNGASVIVYPQTSSLYTVAASDGTCISVTTLSLSVDPNPTISITATSPSVCVGQSVTLTANGGNSYTWTTPSGTSSSNTIQVSPTTATAYTLTGDNSYSCTANTNQVILAFPSPVIGITVTKPVVCTGGLSTLTAAGANSYTWGPAANNAMTPAAIVTSTANVTGTVVYNVTGTFSDTGCPGTQTTMVTVYIPTFAVGGNTNTCEGGKVTLTGAGASSYTWNTGSGPLVTQVLTATVTAPSIYTISASATYSQATCSSTQTIAVGINANPTVIAVAQRTTICKGEFVEIHAGGAATYTWQNPGTGSTNGATLTVSPQNLTNNYTVTGIDANGCAGTGTTQVKVSGCPGFAELSGAKTVVSIYPNPNNGEFTIKHDGPIDLTLCNQLGQIVRTFTLSESNDYMVSVTDLAEGVYFVRGQNENSPVNFKLMVTR